MTQLFCHLLQDEITWNNVADFHEPRLCLSVISYIMGQLSFTNTRDIIAWKVLIQEPNCCKIVCSLLKCNTKRKLSFQHLEIHSGTSYSLEEHHTNFICLQTITSHENLLVQSNCCWDDKDTWQGVPVVGGWRHQRSGTAHRSLTRTWENTTTEITEQSFSNIFLIVFSNFCWSDTAPAAL